MRQETDFGQTAWLSSAGGPAEEPGGEASLRIRSIGPDLVVETESAGRAFVATSIPDWPGWRAKAEAGTSIPLETVNHAFVGFWLPPGRHSVRLNYRPSSWSLGLAAAAAGFAAAVLMATTARRTS